MAEADRRLEAGDLRGSAQYLWKALAIAFHRGVHFDRTGSPLAADPAGFVEPFRLSTAARAMAAPRGRAVPAARGPVEDRPARLLIVTGGNTNFVGEIEARYADDEGFEVRHLDLEEDPELAVRTAGGITVMIENALGGRPEFGAALEAALRPHLDWADTVFIDWC
ncbi:MAG: hypothetical protein ABIS86_23520, partial [Streptosporangiaceae bacterium]